MKCDVCGKDNAKYVAASTYGPESFAYCEECLKNGQRKKATMVDHIVPIKQGGDKFSFSNLQSLCWTCHSRKSAQEGSRWGRKPRDYGNP